MNLGLNLYQVIKVFFFKFITIAILKIFSLNLNNFKRHAVEALEKSKFLETF